MEGSDERTTLLPQQQTDQTQSNDVTGEQTAVEMKLKKKKKDPFFKRKIKISHEDGVNELELLHRMLEKYKKRMQMWMLKAKCFKALNMVLTFLVVFLNVVQVVIFQIPAIPPKLQKSLATCIPCVASLIVSLHQKFDSTKKAVKAKKCTIVYNKIVKHIEHRIQIIEVGGKVDDVIKMWNQALLSEIEEVPSLLVPY